jgi:hypothetical protein
VRSSSDVCLGIHTAFWGGFAFASLRFLLCALQKYGAHVLLAGFLNA